MHTHIDGSRTVRLRPGQPVRLYADAGMHIVADMGRVVVDEAPVWLSDQFLERKMTLCDGEHLVVQRAGWITLEAHGLAEVTCFDARTGVSAKVSASRRSSAALARILARLRCLKWSL